MDNIVKVILAVSGSIELYAEAGQTEEDSESLRRLRIDFVRQTLIDRGVPAEKLTASYEQTETDGASKIGRVRFRVSDQSQISTQYTCYP